jgi:3'-5' exoribonuclease
MAELALRVCGHYPQLDRDLVLVGVLFHDLGKIRELGAMPANDYTLEGRLVGHVVIGRDLLRESCAAVGGVEPDLQLHLEHLVLSHQGRKEYSSPVEPMTPEALVLHFIDDLDSKVNQLEITRESGAGVHWHRGLGRYVWLAEGNEVWEGARAAPLDGYVDVPVDSVAPPARHPAAVERSDEEHLGKGGQGEGPPREKAPAGEAKDPGAPDLGAPSLFD